MGRFIGGRFGSIVPISPGQSALPGIYSMPDQYYSVQDGGWRSPSGISATGGVISDYVDGSEVYRAHIFTGPGQFDVTDVGTMGGTIDYLIVGGGGGTASSDTQRAGGSGAGGLLTGTAVAVSVQPYTVTVGEGGEGARPAPNSGVPSTAFGKTAFGGGGGGFNDPAPTAGGSNGASGGGGWYVNSSTGGFGLNPSTPAPVIASFPGYTPGTTQGYPGSQGFGTPEYGGAGGGAGGGGGRGNSPGPGVASVYAYGPTNPITYAAGGVASDYNNANRTADGAHALGNGGNGEGSGGSGTVVVRYKIGQLTATAKATGGAISFTPTHTIHTFSHTGQFIMPNAYPSTSAQVLVVAGGGSGGPRHGGGGGAGGVVLLPSSNGTLTDGTYTVSIGAGGKGGDGSINGSVGGNTSFGPPASAAAPTHLLALGGGAGMKYPSHTGTNSGGSSGGMGGEPGSQAGSAAQPNPSVYGTSIGYGNAGNTGTNWSNDYRLGGGGGGAGGAGVDGGPSGPQTGAGGVGLQIQIAPNGPNVYYAGGGGGGIWAQDGTGGLHPTRYAGPGGLGGGGGGSASGTTGAAAGSNGGAGVGGGSAISAGADGTSGYLNIGGAGGANTGGGGGGNGQSNYSSWPISSRGGHGGSGVVIISYLT